MKKGKVTVSLKCEATKGKTPKGKVCSGKFTMKVKGVKRTLTPQVPDQDGQGLPDLNQGPERGPRCE